MTKLTPAKEQDLKERQRAPLSTPTDLSAEATRDVTGALNAILADSNQTVAAVVGQVAVVPRPFMERGNSRSNTRG